MTTAVPPARFTRRARTTPLGMVLYGTPGVGKTTQAAAFPGAVICRYELLSTYAEGVATINDALALTPGTFVLDSLDWLERAIHAETCRRHGKASIEAFGYGKGYIEAAVVWVEFLDGMTALRNAGWAVVLLAHHHVVRFDAPDSESYDRYSLKLHKHAAALVTEWAEVIGFMHWETSTTDRENGRGSNTRALGTGYRNIALQETPAFVAKSRYPMPPMIRMDADGHNLLNALASAGAVFPAALTEPTLASFPTALTAQEI
jgi:AAA domain